MTQSIEIRPPEPADYPALAVLHNATHEPHFHTTSAELVARDEQRVDGDGSGRIVADANAEIAGMASFVLEQAGGEQRLWLDLAMHPDHQSGPVARNLIDAVIDGARVNGATSLWLPVREDYLTSWTDPALLGFTEVHRTFGGGFFLSDGRRLIAPPPAQIELVTLDAISQQSGGIERVHELYSGLRRDKVTAIPTIEVAADELDLEDVIYSASNVAMLDATCVGLSIAKRSSLGAWSSVLGVVENQRRRGIGRALLTATVEQLRAEGIGFLNTAGACSDLAYLRTLQSSGATIEPDWIAYELRM